MDKVILIMDKPESCSVCPLFGGVYTDMVCNGNGYVINYPYPKDFRQEWCPLKPLPEKLPEDCVSNFYTGLNIGWNICIDRILEGAID